MRPLPFFLAPALLLGLLNVVPMAHADIGESSAELVKRFGEGRYQTQAVVFDPDPYTVTVILDNDKRSVMEIFARRIDAQGNRVEIEGDDPTTRPPLSETDVRAILALNGNGQRWLPTVPSGKTRIYLRSDNKVMATYSPIQKTVTFQERVQAVPKR